MSVATVTNIRYALRPERLASSSFVSTMLSTTTLKPGVSSNLAVIFTLTESQTNVKPEVSSQIATQTLFQTSLKPSSTQSSHTQSTTMVRNRCNSRKL